MIGLYLPTHVEREDVITAVVQQLRLISDILGDDAPPLAGVAAAAMDSEADGPPPDVSL